MIMKENMITRYWIVEAKRQMILSEWNDKSIISSETKGDIAFLIVFIWSYIIFFYTLYLLIK